MRSLITVLMALWESTGGRWSLDWTAMTSSSYSGIYQSAGLDGIDIVRVVVDDHGGDPYHMQRSTSRAQDHLGIPLPFSSFSTITNPDASMLLQVTLCILCRASSSQM